MGRGSPGWAEALPASWNSSWAALGKNCRQAVLFPKESQGQGSGLQQQQGPFSPRDSCREQVPAWLPSNPPKDKEFGGLTQCSELPSLLAGTL